MPVGRIVICGARSVGVLVTDPNSNVTSYLYDDFGQMLRQTSPVSGVTTYQYDLGGTLISTSDANGATTMRTYDVAGRVLSAVSSRVGATTETVTWTYGTTGAAPFGRNRLVSMTDPSGATSYEYERRGMIARENKTIGQAIYTSSFTYDADGNRASITYPSGLIASYGHDFAGRPVSASTASGITLVSSAQYLPFGPARDILYGNGTRQTMQHDSRYRLTQNKLAGPSGTVVQHDYTLDAAGNVTAIDDYLDAGYNRTFGYDDLNRLTTANTGAALWGSGSYSYDAMGNLLSVKLGDPALTPFAQEGYFRYVGTTPKIEAVRKTSLPDDYDTNLSLPRRKPGIQSVGYGTVTYDPAGNELSYIAGRSYSARNLLQSVTDAGETSADLHRLDYQYDGRGIRVARSETQQSGPTPTRYYIYSPELQLLSMTRDDQANAWGSRIRTDAVPPVKHDFVWFAGRPLAQISADFTDGPHWYFNDHLGTPILQTNATASTVWHAEYEPFGDIWKLRAPIAPEEGPSPVIDQPLRFPGQEVAMTWEGTEERYNIFRWYRAGWGRYSSADPIGLVGREYLYASNNPILHTDMLGLRDTGAALGRPVFRKVCDTSTKAGRGLAGRALGLIAMIMSASDANPVEFEADRGECVVCDEREKRRRCRPCIPPVGTLAFREDTNPRSRPHRGVPPPHWKLYEMHQSPPEAGCRCFWHPIPDNKGGFGASPPPDGTVPITEPAGGGFW